jgi:hypothetical protein
MKTVWSARVHKSGDRVQLLKNGSVTKIIRAGDATFTATDAQTFAKGLVEKLNTRYAKQMEDPKADPSVATKGDEQRESMKALNQDAKGISPKEASLSVENANLKKKIAGLEKSASIERKARRGLAIAKMLVDQKKIANTEEAVKAEVAKIATMSNDEITLVERKVAGQSLYDTTDDAMKASRRYARMSRLHRQAAEDAQLAGDDELADAEDEKAANCENLSKQAADAYAQFDNKHGPITPDDAENQVKGDPKGVDAQGKKAADAGVKKTADDDDDADDIDDVDEDALIEDMDDEGIDEDDDEDDFEDEDMNVEAAAAIYRKIASNHKEAAETFKKEGKTKEADNELEIAKEADELADSISDEEVEDDVDEEDFSKEAANIYRKIASEHRKKADDLEAEGKTVEADTEDEIADEADELANTVEASCKAGCDNPAVAPVVDPVAAAAPVVAAVDTPVEAVAAVDAVDTDAVDADAGEDKEAKTTEDDPLAAMLGDDEKQANADEDADDVDDGSMPSDEEITAAVANEDYEDEKTSENDNVEKIAEVESTEEDAVEDDKTAASSGKKKIANVGHNASDSDRIEQNPFAGDSTVRGLEDLWRKEE